MADDRIVIISDLHFGRARAAATSADALRPLWDGAQQLIVNGDAAEIHHPRHRGKAARDVLRLADLCHADDVALTMLSGNHDPFITDTRHLLLAGDRIFVTHGDVLHPAVSPWSPAGRRVRAAHRVAMERLEPETDDPLELRLSASQFASFAEWVDLARLELEAKRSTFLGMFLRPWAIVRVLHYWTVAPRLTARFMREHVPAARFGVLGHTHHPGVWTIDGRTIINTGSFGFPGRPFAVVVEGDALEFVAIERTGERYRFARSPRATFDISADEVVLAEAMKPRSDGATKG